MSKYFQPEIECADPAELKFPVCQLGLKRRHLLTKTVDFLSLCKHYLKKLTLLQFREVRSFFIQFFIRVSVRSHLYVMTFLFMNMHPPACNKHYATSEHKQAAQNVENRSAYAAGGRQFITCGVGYLQCIHFCIGTVRIAVSAIRKKNIK